MTPLSDLQKPVDRHVWSAQFVTTPTADTPGTTLLLRFDNKRYLFGRVAEGTQRACTERGVSLKKARNIFLTGETNWEQNSGLLGMILTLADVVAETNEEERQTLGFLRIHGGPKLWHTIACARRFIFRTGMPLRVFEANPEEWKVTEQPDFVDENILLWALPVQRKPSSETSAMERNSPGALSSKVQHEQSLRQKTVHDMFDSGWRKDKLSDAIFRDVKLPAMVWVRDPETKDLQSTFCTTMSDAPHIDPNQKVLVRMPWPAALISELPPADDLPSAVAMSYFIRGRPQRGTFVAKKAKDLGVPPGPSFGILASGQPVTLEDGRVVQPEEVMEPTLPGSGMAVLDVPNIHYLPDLMHKLNDMQSAQVLTNVHVFIWILGSGVVHSQAFSDFTAQFSSVKHVVSSGEDSPNHLAMDSSAASAARLAQIRPGVFTVPLHDNKSKRAQIYNDNIMQAERGLVLQAAPKFDTIDDEVPDYLDIDAKIADLSNETKNLIPAGSDAESRFDGKHGDVSITTLGTGSALPSKYRNVSANLLHIPSLGYFILDAGENTMGQLKRLYNNDDLDDILCNLHMIWISHLHADHHLGTVSLLAAHKAATQRRQVSGNRVVHKLYLVSEKNMADYLEDYKSIEGNDAVMLRCLNSEITDLDGNAVELHDTSLPVSKLDTTRVSHCHGAQAISITFSNGFKLSYSGDCRPSASFAQIGRDSDVLIHEATFDDGMEGDAMAKKHSTIGEALGVATAMQAKNVILTHFSQRYQKLPTLKDVNFSGQLKFEEGDDANDPAGPLEDAETTNGESTIATSGAATSGGPAGIAAPSNGVQLPALRKQTSLQEAAERMSICIAFDLMRVTIPQIKDMYKYYPAIETMFEHEQAKSDEKRGANRAANEARLEARNKKLEGKRKEGEAKKGEKPQKKEKSKESKSKSAKTKPIRNVAHMTKQQPTEPTEAVKRTGLGDRAFREEQTRAKRVKRDVGVS